MAVRKFVQPDNSSQTGATYKGSIDDAIAVAAQLGDQFAPHAKDTPDLTALVDAGRMLVSSALVSQSQQTVSGFVATGANQRIDRIVGDLLTGAATRVAGAESASPVAPSVPAGKFPIAQVGPFTTSTTAITNSMITDERVLLVPPVGKQTIWVPAGAMVARTSAGAAGPNTIETATNKVNLRTLDFDQTTQQFAQFQVAMPKGWDLGTLTAKFYWLARAGTGDAIWGIQGVALGDNEALDTAFGTAQTVTDTSNGTDKVNETAETSAITIGSSPAARDDVIFQVYRDAAVGGDTLTATALLLGVALTFNFNGTDDA